MADAKRAPCVSEMSSDSPVRELYSPPTDSPTVCGGGYNPFGYCHPWYDLPRGQSNVWRRDAPGTPLAELEWSPLRSNVAAPVVTKQHASGMAAVELPSESRSPLHTPTPTPTPTSTASDLARPHIAWPQQIDSFHRSLDAAQSMTLSTSDRSQFDPNLSPQTSSHESWPITPETGNTAGVDISMLTGGAHAASVHAVSAHDIDTFQEHFHEPHIQESPNDYAPLGVDGSLLADLNCVDLPMPTVPAPTDENVNITAQYYWTQHDMASQANPQQGETCFENPIAAWNGASVYQTSFDSGRDLSFTAPPHGMRRSYTSPSSIPGPQQPSHSDFRVRNASWPMEVEQAWTAIDEEALTLVNHFFDQNAEANNANGNDQSLTTARVDASSAPKRITPKKVFPSVKCEDCPQIFTGQYARGNRRRHTIHVHERGGVICKVCRKSFNRGDALRTHERSAHSQLGHAAPKKRTPQPRRQATYRCGRDALWS